MMTEDVNLEEFTEEELACIKHIGEDEGEGIVPRTLFRLGLIRLKSNTEDPILELTDKGEALFQKLQKSTQKLSYEEYMKRNDKSGRY